MRKSIIIASVICLFLILVIVISVFGTSDYNIRLGNDIITMQYPSFMQNDRLYVSVRSLCNALGIPIYWNEKENEVHMDIYNKQIQVSDKTERKIDGVIPDKETAYTVGKAILEKYIEKPLEYETDTRIYYLDTRYLEEENAWQLVQVFRFKDDNVGGGIDGWADFINIKLSKSTGEVLFINTYGTYSQ